MNSKIILLILFILIHQTLIAGSNNYPNNDQDSSLVITLKKKKKGIDLLYSSLYNSDNKNVYVKIKGKTNPVKIVSSIWPDSIQITYSIILDSTRKAVLILEHWRPQNLQLSNISFFVRKYYFDHKGKIFAFEQSIGFYGLDCIQAGEEISETSIEFFNRKFKRISRERKEEFSLEGLFKVKECDFPKYELAKIKKLKKYLKVNKIKIDR